MGGPIGPDGSPCICRGATTTTTHPLGWVAPALQGFAQHLHDWPELTGHLPSAGKQPQLRPTRSDGSPCTAGGCTTHMFPPTGRGRPCYAGAMHVTHAAPHLPRGVDPAIQGQCTLTTGDRRCMQGQTIIIYLSGRAAHAHTSYNPPPTSYIAYNPSQ